MNLKDYQEYCWKQLNPEIKEDNKICETYLFCKLMNEVGELAIESNNFENDKIKEEAGDVYWYFANLFYFYDIWVPEQYKTPRTSQCSHTILQDLISNGLIYQGDLLKKVWHKKAILNEEMSYKILNLYTLFLQFLQYLNLDPATIRQENYEKLKKRHGSEYNKEFYQNA